MYASYNFNRPENDSQNYYFFENGFDKEELTLIEQSVSEVPFETATTVGGVVNDVRSSSIKWLHQTLKMGWSGPKRYHKHNYKPQWRWSCGYRDCYKLAKLLLPYAKVKVNKLQEGIKHYDRKR